MCAVGQSEQPALATTANVGSVLGGQPLSASPLRAAARGRGSLLTGTIGGGITAGGGSGGSGRPNRPSEPTTANRN